MLSTKRMLNTMKSTSHCEDCENKVCDNRQQKACELQEAIIKDPTNEKVWALILYLQPYLEATILKYAR